MSILDYGLLTLTQGGNGQYGQKNLVRLARMSHSNSVYSPWEALSYSIYTSSAGSRTDGMICYVQRLTNINLCYVFVIGLQLAAKPAFVRLEARD